ncbi:MAG: hypothetical protein ACD_7C00020G0024 [uncultured bacterium]|nr:MAG: hypothetical protein ACD_7C00020G0024 [uncultured bacterium]
MLNKMSINFTDEQLKEFKELYKKEFGEDISDEYAIKIASQFVDLLEAVYKK